MIPKEYLALTAIAITTYAYFPYLKSILKGETKPHLFSWIIWALTTTIVFFAQFYNEGGAGVFSTAFSSLVCFVIAYLTYKKVGMSVVTRSDWLFLTLALMALPLWYVTSDALYAVILLCIIDTLGFLPTFKKAYYYPFEEQLSFFMLMAFKELFVLMALEHYSLTTILFPITLVTTTTIFVLMVYRQRGKLGRA